MAIKRTPKAWKPKRVARTDGPVDVRLCSRCGRSHRSGATGSFVVPSLMLPTEYLCSKPCYDEWCAEFPSPSTVSGRREKSADTPSIARDLPPPLFEV